MSKNEDIHITNESGDPDRFLKEAKQNALDVHNATEPELTVNDLYIVWFAKELQNWKALVATTVHGDGLYYEVTHNGDRDETYVDKYLKQLNYVISNIPAH